MKAIRSGGLFVLAMVCMQAAVLQAAAEDKAQKQKDINKMAQATLQQHGREDPHSGLW